MNTISLISAIAVVVSIGGIFPQIVAMFQARSSAGQSAVGWCLGVMVNGLLGYVNLVGLHSTMLATGNAVGLILSATALGLVFRYRDGAGSQRPGRLDPGAAVSALLDPGHAPLIDLETAELDALHGAVIHARATRRCPTADRPGGPVRTGAPGPRPRATASPAGRLTASRSS